MCPTPVSLRLDFKFRFRDVVQPRCTKDLEEKTKERQADNEASDSLTERAARSALRDGRRAYEFCKLRFRRADLVSHVRTLMAKLHLNPVSLRPDYKFYF